MILKWSVTNAPSAKPNTNLSARHEELKDLNTKMLDSTAEKAQLSTEIRERKTKLHGDNTNLHKLNDALATTITELCANQTLLLGITKSRPGARLILSSLLLPSPKRHQKTGIGMDPTKNKDTDCRGDSFS